MNVKAGFIIFCALLLGNSAFAQNIDSARHSPTRATIYSAALPGLGQAYNRNYWKIPVIYAGFGGLSYGVFFYQRQFKEFRRVYNDYSKELKEYQDAQNTDIPKPEKPNENLLVFGKKGYTPESVRAGRDHYRRYRDMFVIGVGAWYLLNVLDAYVYANLFDFDVSDNLSFRINPTVIPTANARLSPGLNISFSF